MSARRIHRTLILATVGLALVGAACQPADVLNLPRAKVGARCAAPGRFARDATRVLQCSARRRWAVNMSIAQAVSMIDAFNTPGTVERLAGNVWTTTEAGDGRHHAVQFRVLSRLGTPMAGRTVHFSQSGLGTVDFLTAADVVTGADGIATLVVTSGTRAGGVDVRGTVDGTTLWANRLFAIEEGEVDHWVIESGDAQTVAVGQSFPTPLVARLVDRFGNGVPFEEVDIYVTTGMELAPYTDGSEDLATDGSGRFGVIARAGSGAAVGTAGVLFEHLRDDGQVIDIDFDLQVT